jgi:glutamine amidotransferase-like uncharacterized protein
MLCAFFIGSSTFAQFGHSVRADDAKDARTIRVAIYADAGVSKGDPAQVRACLPESNGFIVKNITAKSVRGGALDQFDVLIHPGGSGGGQAKSLGPDGLKRVREFVDGGGGFIGICAGTYLASDEYPSGLELIDARLVDVRHWARGVGKVNLRLPTEGRAALGTDDALQTIHYENGPLLSPGENKDISDFESLAVFESEIAENGAPSGVMKGTTAIARGEFGQGRVVCFSPHPEKSRGCKSFVTAAVRWAAKAQGDDNTKPSSTTQPQSGATQ